MKETTWCLNNEVIFIPTRRILSRRDGSVEPIILNEPTAKILDILLTYNGITPQKELYELAWKNNGAKTTPNNLYQNISLLRRSLNSIFLRKGEYIITAPRRGFYISPKVNIEIIDDGYALPLPESRHLSANTGNDLRYTFLARVSGRLRRIFTNSITEHRSYLGGMLLIILVMFILILYYVITPGSLVNPPPKKTDSFCDGEKVLN